MTRQDNPFFAKSLVNRYWKHFFGRGLVEPEDDMRETNPPTNPELLDALAKHFVASGFDLKDLVRTICNRSTYQLSAEPERVQRGDKQNFSPLLSEAPARRSAARRGRPADRRAQTAFAGLPAGTRAVRCRTTATTHSYFLTVFGRPEGIKRLRMRALQEASLAQSLHLLNAQDIQTKLTANDGRAAATGERRDARAEKLRELYMTAFSREPRADEVEARRDAPDQTAHEAEGKPLDPEPAKRQGYEDLLWALINTKEFLFNH